ncbi:P-loop containing nucleoside triphosphate hydrolase protein [Cokeromyces recurvatus]|uniref:P-loop containing nucleoside triphosphate hydrolase protein n=1 Tax=Cokeromyces recurvatus TaxID=90255 RepID=UPI00221E82E5|nr:P-loop containing nucleoside triphosphate hydrolase protein [Cokeromyces recurvatus]KAI7898041.1 P-loop containing nucleoside triphosphate hydrolase protein [Cokeromyces recurvatus]
MYIIGPRKSGKTTFLYKSVVKYNTEEANNEFKIIPTSNFNVEVIKYKSYLFEIWDFAETLSCLNHPSHPQVIIYMIDSIEYSKEMTTTKSRESMAWLLENAYSQIKNTIIITVANKMNNINDDIQDIGITWTNDDRLYKLLKGHDWRLFPCNSSNGEGFDLIFDYLIMKLKDQEQKNAVTPWELLANPHHLHDPEFFLWFQQGRAFLFFDHQSLIRIIYLTIVTRKKHQLLHEQLAALSSINYSETQTLFWVHMVSFALLKSPLLEGQKPDFSLFLKRSKLEEDCWKDYYSQKVFYSERATKEFIPPDKKPLPNAFRPSSLALKGSGLRIDYQIL